MSYGTVVDTALSQIRTTEYPPNSNKVKYNTEYYGYEVSGPEYPWCITFLWWCFTHGGETTAFYGGNKTASSTQLMNYYIGQGRFVTSGYQIGDIVFYNFDGGSGADHAEIIVSVGNGTYVTVGGNTTPGDEGSQNNGGCVAKKTRYASQFLGAGRPSYGSSGGGSTEPTALRTKIIQATSRVLAMRHLVPESVAVMGKAEIGPFNISDTWWVDYRGYIYDRSGDNLRVRNGFTDEVIDMSEPCLGRSNSTNNRMRVFDNVLGYCVKRESNEDNHQTWRFRYYDGTVTEIKMPFSAVSSGVYFTNYYDPIWGFSNGILAISYSGANGQKCWTYTKNGDFIFETASLSGGVRWPCIEKVLPLSGYSVGVIKSGSDGRENYYWDSYSILSDTCENISNDPLFAPYYPTFPSGVYKSKQTTRLGEDNQYFYAAARMYDSNGDATGEWVIAKFDKFNFSGPIEITRYNGSRDWKTCSESKILSYISSKYSSMNVSPSDFQYMHIIDSNDIDIYDPTENPIEQGGIDKYGRDVNNNQVTIRTNGFISVIEGATYLLSSNIDQGYVFFYDSSYKYKRSTNGQIKLPGSFTVPTGSVYARIDLSKQQEYYCRLVNLQSGTKYMNGKFDFTKSSNSFHGAYDNNAYIWIDEKGIFRKRGY